MRGPLVVLFSGLMLAGALVTGCGGGGGGGSAPVVPGRSVQVNTTVNVSLFIPQKTVQGKRVPKFVSPSTQSALIEMIGPIPSPSASATPNAGTAPLVAEGYTNLNSQSCTSNGSGETCNISLAASITQAGLYGIAVITSDQPQSSACTFITNSTPPPSPTPLPSGGCVGNALGLNIAAANITPGSVSAINIALGGIPAYFQPVELVSGMIGGNNANLQVFGPNAASASFELLDADKNVIVGPNPLALTVINPQPLAATVTVSNTPDPTGLYTLSITPSTSAVNGLNLINPTTETLTMVGSINSNFNALASPTPVTLQSFQFGLQVSHSEVAVQKSGGQIDLFLDGNTTPSYTVYGSGASQLGLAFDANSNLWVADPQNGDLVEFGQSAAGVPPVENTVYCGLGGGSGNCTSTGTTTFSPSFIDIDANGDLFASYWNGSIYQFAEWNNVTPGTVPSPLTPSGWFVNGTASMNFCHLAADNTGHIYVGSSNYVGPGYNYQLTNYQVGALTGTSISAANINGVAFGQDGQLWYLADNGATSTVWKYNPANSTATTPVTGLIGGPYQGIAVDMLGNLYVADGSTAGVTEYPASSGYTTHSSIGTSANPAGVAVFPNGLYGSNHPVGVPHPTQSPFPISNNPII